MATKGAQSIQNTCTASNNIIDVGSYCKVVRRSDAQDQDVLDSLKTLYNVWW